MTRTLRRLVLHIYRVIGGFCTESGAVFAARLLQNANGFVLSIMLTRKFGLQAVGTLTISSSATVVLGTLCTFGLPFVFAHAKHSMCMRNMIGLVMSCAAILLSVPVCIAFGMIFGTDRSDAIAIIFLSMAGPFFAQTAIANALLVLQSGAGHVLWSPLGNLIGLIAGYVLTDDFPTFCMILAAFRFGGSFATFGTLRMERASTGAFAAHLRSGVRFLGADTLNLIAEQATIVAASGILTRESLGLFGLSRQLITVSDTPASSSAVVWYPRACEHPAETFAALQRHLLALGVMCAITLSVLSVPIGFWVYNLPEFAWLAPLLMVCVPFRYLSYAYEVTIRALNSMAALRTLTIVRCIVAVVPPCGMLVAGLFGGIIGVIAQVVVATWVAWKVARQALNARERAQQRTDLLAISSC